MSLILVIVVVLGAFCGRQELGGFPLVGLFGLPVGLDLLDEVLALLPGRSGGGVRL